MGIYPNMALPKSSIIIHNSRLSQNNLGKISRDIPTTLSMVRAAILTNVDKMLRK